MSRRKSRRNKPAGNAANNGRPNSHDKTPLRREDADLWAAVTQSLTPLKEDHDRLHFGPLLDEKPETSGHYPLSEKKPNAAQTGQKNQAKPQSPVSGPQNSIQAPPELQPHNHFTRREMRRVSSGRQAIEARIDLHGLHQAAAHATLTGFIMQSHARGLRHVLVITGKGRSSPVDNSQYGEPEIGVLRRMVPLWLHEPGLKDLVAGFTLAPRNHGGEGALYVRLRRNRST